MAQDPLFEVFRQIDEQNRMAYLADKLLAIKDCTANVNFCITA